MAKARKRKKIAAKPPPLPSTSAPTKTQTREEAARAAGLVTRAELAHSVDLHPISISKMETEGLPVADRGGPGRPSYYREEDVRLWLKVRAEAASKKPELLNALQSRARREEAQGRLAEQTFQMRSKELLPRIEVERVWEAEIVAVRTKLLAIPPTFAERVYQAAVSEGINGVERVLGESVNDVLLELMAGDEARTA